MSKALELVRADKRREAIDGHDGTWVAHPGLVAIALEEFNAVMKGPNQIAKKREDVYVTAANLVQVPEGQNYGRRSAQQYQRELTIPGIMVARFWLCTYQ